MATTNAARPRSIPGIRAKSDTVSASVRAENATPARMSNSTCCAAVGSAGATEIATNSSPMRAPATPALLAKNTEKSEGTKTRTVALLLVSRA